MNDQLRGEIARLGQMKVGELKQRYVEVFGEASASSNRLHLLRRLAWRMQARAEGELSGRARQRATELADEVQLRVRAPLSFWRELDHSPAPNTRRDPRLPAPGTQLERHYQGQTLTVRVLQDGFEYNGKHYRSLSAIAYRVTGTRWNGFLFFASSLERQQKNA